jgi:hypothetical protein
MNRKTILALNVICPIIVGAFIYYLTSPNVIFVKIIDAVIGGIISFHISPINNIFFRLIRNYFLDMLWGYALVFALFYIFDNNAVKTGKLFGVAFSFSSVLEILQIMPFVQGTFDIFDIAVEFLAEGIAAFIINYI